LVGGDEPDAHQRLHAEVSSGGAASEGDVPAPQGAGVSKSATSRRFVALSAARMKKWMASDLGHLDIMVVQIDGIHIVEDIVLVAAIGIDSEAQNTRWG